MVGCRHAPHPPIFWKRRLIDTLCNRTNEVTPAFLPNNPSYYRLNPSGPTMSSSIAVAGPRTPTDCHRGKGNYECEEGRNEPAN